MNTEELADLERHNDDMYINRLLCTPKVYKIVFDDSLDMGVFYIRTANSDFETKLRSISDYKEMVVYLDQNEDKFTEIFDTKDANEVIDLSESIKKAIEDETISVVEKFV